MDRLAEFAPVTDAMVPRIARVVRRVRDLPDTVTLELVSADGQPLMRYAPGQFTMMYVFGVGEIPVSISGDSSDTTRLVQTVRAVGKVSEAVTRLPVGPSPELPLDRASWIVVDKISTVRRNRIGRRIGCLSQTDLQRLNSSIAVFLGLG